MDYGYQTIRRDGGIYLDADGVFGRSPEPLDVEVLLHPFEEQLDLPAVLVSQSDFQGVKRQGVGQEGELPVLLLVIKHDASQKSGILLLGSVAGQPDEGVRENVLRHPPFPPDSLELEVGFGPDHEERLQLADDAEPLEVVVSAVKDVERARFIRYLVHRPHVVDRSLRDVDEGRDLGFQVIKGVYLDTALGPAESGPLVHAQAEVYRGGVEGVDITSKIKHVLYPLRPGLSYHVVGELLEDAEVSVGVGLRQVAERHAFPKAQMEVLLVMGRDDEGEITETFPIAQLAEHQHKQLVPASERLDVVVALVLVNDVAELVAVEEIG